MTEITLQEAKNQIAQTITNYRTGGIDIKYRNWEQFQGQEYISRGIVEKHSDEAAELYASQYKTELSSKEALIGELKEALNYCQVALAIAIETTPTGDFRNQMTDANIHALTILKKLTNKN